LPEAASVADGFVSTLRLQKHVFCSWLADRLMRGVVMARYPKIDSPCPLGIDEQLRIDGFCKRCDKHVHALDQMSQQQRDQFMRVSNGPLCVSYRMPRRIAGLGVAIAVTLVTSGALAGETLLQAPAAAATQSPVTAEDVLADEAMLDFIIVGGVNDPQDAGWIEDDTLPELPVRDAGDGDADESDPVLLDRITFVGGVDDPGRVEWIDDALPELPVRAATSVPENQSGE
jgi:hypothetical protein